MKGTIIALEEVLVSLGLEAQKAAVVAYCVFAFIAITVFLVVAAMLSTGVQLIDRLYIHRTNIYVDMDGTVAQWMVGGNWQEKGYYEKLPVMQGMVDVVKCLRRDHHFNVIFLTCVINEDAQKEKMTWLKKVFGKVNEKEVIFVPFGENKADYIIGKSNDILLDDHTPNCMAWGGKAIKVMNGINGLKGRWNGPRIYADDRIQFILDTIERIDAA